MCKVYTGYCGTSEIEHGLCACTVDNPLAKARGLSLRTGAQPMLYLPHVLIIFITICMTSYLDQTSLYKFRLAWNSKLTIFEFLKFLGDQVSMRVETLC